MTKTKIAAVLLGAGAGLIAGAPLAFAGDMPSHDGGDHGHSRHHDGDHGGRGGDTCSVKGGSAYAENNGKVDGLVGAVTQAPVGGANIANITCSPFLNDNVRDNLNGNTLNADVL